MAKYNHIVVTRYKRLNHAIFSDFHVYGSSRHLYYTKAMELPYRDNKRNISSIPAGTYPIRLEYSPKFDEMLWELYGVPGRSECKIHVANFARQLNGCIALGGTIADIDKDGELDIANSRKSLDDFHKVMKGTKEGLITIIDVFNY